MTLNELAQLLTVKAKGDTYKATTPNPKAEILQISLDSNNIVTVQVAEPLMLSTMQHSYAIGPSDMSLFLTISPDWRKTLLFDHSGQYGCGTAGAIVNGISLIDKLEANDQTKHDRKQQCRRVVELIGSNKTNVNALQLQLCLVVWRHLVDQGVRFVRIRYGMVMTYAQLGC